MVFRPFDPEKKKQLMDRIRQIMAKNKKNLHQLHEKDSEERRLENLIFKDYHEDSSSVAEAQTVKQFSPSQSETSSSGPKSQGFITASDLMKTESLLSDSSSNIHEPSARRNRPLDEGSKAAFEISNRSTEALELSL